jgi:hypothetical protein
MKTGNGLWPVPFNSALDYAIRNVQGSKDCLKLNEKHQFLFYAEEINFGRLRKYRE